MRILHFAVENTARVPGQLVRAERALGHDSRLVTLVRSAHGHRDEDLCLEVPFLRPRAVRAVSAGLGSGAGAGVRRREPGGGTPVWRPRHAAADLLFRLRDRIWAPRVRRALESLGAESIDVLFLDGGLGFLRHDPFVPALKAAGVRVAVGYFGSDLRVRGILPEIDRLADYRFTVEFDHTLLYPGIDFVYFPFRLPPFTPAERPDGRALRVGHSPTNRAAKGTDAILAQLARLGRERPVETVLIENRPQAEALSLKSTCDLFVDQVGELGYGISGLEALAMGIPTACQILPDFEGRLGGHPFINANAGDLADRLRPFADSPDLRREWGARGRAWVEARHDPAAVARSLLARIPARSGSKEATWPSR